MSYPVKQYRPNTNGAGFQSPSLPARGIPSPANDNKRPLPIPANDNIRRLKPNKNYKKFFKPLVNKFPYVGAALLAYDLWDQFKTENKNNENRKYFGVWQEGGFTADPRAFEGEYGPDKMGWSTKDRTPNVSPWHGYADRNLGGQYWHKDNLWGVGTIVKSVVIFRLRPHTSYPRYEHFESYWRPWSEQGNPTTWPKRQIVPQEVPVPLPYEQLDPFLQPPKKTKPKPSPVPWEAIPSIPDVNPYRSPVEQPIRQPRPLPRFLPRVTPRPDPKKKKRPDPKRRDNPRTRPDTEPPMVDTIPLSPNFPSIEISPNNPPRFLPDPHANKKPPSGTKERKVTMNDVIPSILIDGLNIVTETNDLIDAIYEALPDHLKPYKPSPQEKLELIYLHYDKLDMLEVLNNIVYENIEDYIFGKLGQINAHASSKTDRPFGFQSGLLH